MEAKFRPVVRLFGVPGARFEVPEYQRGYEWGKKNFEDLWTDISRIGERVNKHYLGNIILLEKENGWYEIVDGQQRMVTLSILTIAIREQLNNKEDTRIEHILDSSSSGEKERKIYLHENEPEMAYEALWRGDKESISGNVRTAFEFFESRVSSMTAEELEELLENVANQLKVVKTVSEDTSLAYMIFQSQNERGIEVDPEVLIKARVFGEAERLPRESNEQYVKEKWKEIYRRLEQELGRPRFTPDLRVRRPLTQILLNSELRTPVEIDKSALYRTFDEGLKKSGSVKTMVENFDSMIGKYLNISSGGYDVDATGYSRSVRRYLQYFNVSTTHAETLTLAIINRDQSEKELEESIRLAAVLGMRTLLGNMKSSDRKKIIHSASQSIRRGGNPREEISSAIRAESPTDPEIVENLKANGQSIRGPWRIRTLLKLVSIEERRRGPIRMNLENLHIEHIAPRNTFGASGSGYGKWRKSLDENRFPEIKDHIGNLTLLDPEAHGNLDEGSLDSKRNAYRNSDIKMSEELSENINWGCTSIEERSENLAKELVREWSI